VPFLPVSGTAEMKLFTDLLSRNTTSKPDFERMAIQWCSYVDGKTIFPKLPVYLRTYYTSWEHNNAVRASAKLAEGGAKVLIKVNNLTNKAPAASPPGAPPVSAPPQYAPFSAPLVVAPNVAPAIVGGLLLGLSVPPQTAGEGGGGGGGGGGVGTATRGNGERGKDSKTRKARKCQLCVKNGGGNAETCTGRGPRGKCDYFCQLCLKKGGSNAATCSGRGAKGSCGHFMED